MAESVILQLPLALVLYGIALGLFLFDRRHRASKGILAVTSTVLAVGATAYAVLMGTPLVECATVLMLFLLLNLGARE